MPSHQLQHVTGAQVQQFKLQQDLSTAARGTMPILARQGKAQPSAGMLCSNTSSGLQKAQCPLIADAAQRWLQ